MPHGLDAATVEGAIPRPKSDSFEDSLPFFDSKLLQLAPPPPVATPTTTDSPTRASFSGLSLASTPTTTTAPGTVDGGGDASSDRGSIFAKLRKPGSISSLSSFLDRRKNNSGSSNHHGAASNGGGGGNHHSHSSLSLFKHASSNASKASLVSMESRDSGYRNPWTDSGVNLPELGPPTGNHPHAYGGIYQHHPHGSGGSAISLNGWPAPVPNGPAPARGYPDRKASFGAVSAVSALSAAPGQVGDATPRHENGNSGGVGPLRPRPSFSESQPSRPATSHSINGQAPIGTPR